MKYKLQDKSKTEELFVLVDGEYKKVKRLDKHPRPASDGSLFGSNTIKVYY